jgi:hypothetical protein
MRPVLLLLFLSAVATADDDAERSAIRNTLAALNQPAIWDDRYTLSELFTADADRTEIERLAAAHRARLKAADRPWSETTRPRIVVHSIRFVTPDAALVDVTDAQYGSIGPSNTALLFVMKKQSAGWRIASVRMNRCP